MKSLVFFLFFLATPPLIAGTADDCDDQLKSLLRVGHNRYGYYYSKENYFIDRPTLRVVKEIDLQDSLIEIENTFSKNLQVFKGHFPGKNNAIFPGVLHLETMGQAAQELMKIIFRHEHIKRHKLIKVSNLKLSSPILPGDNVKIKVTLIKRENIQLTFAGEIIDPETEKVLSTASFTYGPRLEEKKIAFDYAEPNSPIMRHKEVMKNLPHREPFLFIDEVMEINSIQNLAKESFDQNYIFAKYQIDDLNPLLPIKVDKKVKTPTFHGALQIEAIAQAAGLLVSDYVKSFSDKKLNFILTSISDFESFVQVRAGDTLYIKSKVSKPWKGTFEKRAIADLEGEVYIRSNANGALVLASKVKARAIAAFKD